MSPQEAESSPPAPSQPFKALSRLPLVKWVVRYHSKRATIQRERHTRNAHIRILESNFTSEIVLSVKNSDWYLLQVHNDRWNEAGSQPFWECVNLVVSNFLRCDVQLPGMREPPVSLKQFQQVLAVVFKPAVVSNVMGCINNPRGGCNKAFFSTTILELIRRVVEKKFEGQVNQATES